jgi:uncharacterized protein YecE (DUF72 family)
MAKLADANELVAAFVHAAGELGARLGPLLFQLPPFLRKDLDRLVSFLESSRSVAPLNRFAFEFRHPSWFDDDVFGALRAHGASLCVAEGEALASPLVATADWGYVRLRRDAYPDELVAEWATRIRAQPWKEVFVYLKHDDGNAPNVAARLIAALGSAAALT